MNTIPFIPSMMRHLIKAPCPELSDMVKCFWSFETDEAIKGKIQISTFVNDSTGITFVLDKNNPLYRATIEGHNTQPRVFCPVNSIRAFGVQFHTGTISRLFGFDASEVTDHEYNLHDVVSWNISDAILNAPTFELKCDILTKFLLHLSRKKNQLDQVVQECLAQIYSKRGILRVSDLHARNSISERQLERKFSSQIGVSPRLLLKVTRFQEAVKILKGDQGVSLTDAALDAGYYDQSHFIKDVKRLSGFTPKELHQRLHKLSVNQKGSTRYLIDFTPTAPRVSAKESRFHAEEGSRFEWRATAR